MSGFTKLFGTLVTSTIWREDDKTRVVWITMLAMADRHGYVAASVPGLAAIANVATEECRAALLRLKAPDLDSRTKDREGRRLEDADGGWTILNYAKYRELGRSVDRTEYLRVKKQESRSRKAGQPMSTDGNHVQPISEAEAEAYKKEDTEGASASPREIEYPAAFTQIWDLTGKRGVKAKALKAWKANGRPNIEQVRAPWESYLLSERPRAGFVQDLSTWLNGRGWQQEWAPATQKPSVDSRPQWQREATAQGQRERQASVRYHERQAEEKHPCGYHLYRGEDKRFVLEECPKNCTQYGRDLDGNKIAVR